MALWIGLYPKPFFQILEQPVNQIAHDVHENAKNIVAAVPAATSQTAAVTPAADSAKGKD
jgi:hypothetical protein